MTRVILVVWLAFAGPALAVEPSEMLADPAQEARAQALDEQLRCVKCRSESIATSHADWASDARVRLRELIAAGRSDAEIKAFFVDRYGDFVLMRPTAEGINLVLWMAPPAMLVFAVAIGAVYVRARRRAAEPRDAALSDAERARLDEILGDD